ncbi:hypothetical protein IVB12_01295 [Bradyrhizobium sp. 179]|uniref:hypothetical protein n=1 Tax=Bradyrhizobium sp. 179 TaxID=2782648 RepID=UPI001FFBB74C|nr:hypothetical protein [Bradyrhizobium sp. 179]MCK1540659.1 hypothetical protein [Bradyrhizobium sp. 179]
MSFHILFEKVLLPTLQPGNVGVLVNLGSHRNKVVGQLIRLAGANLFFRPIMRQT